MLEKLANLDRRIIFLFVGLAVLIPIIFPLGLPNAVSQPVQNIYDFVETIPEGSLVFISFDYGPSTKIECEPMALAVTKQLFRRNIKVVGWALWPEGASMARNVFDVTGKEYNKKYGVDYINLGYKAGGSITIKEIGEDIRSTFPQDVDNISIDKYSVMDGVKNYKNFKLGVSVSAGVPGLREYIVVANSIFGVPIAGGCTAVSAPEMYPYLNSKQMVGLMGGLKGAAEYETLMNYVGDASKGMDAQSIAHLLIVLFVIMSNIIFFMQKKK
ncbi:MAG: hypothetical protein M1269_12610 [Chloroflexi bacterium]|nr:hypothetical protein [Chloroflexota bacterium]